ncbi:class I glutamine amidotransferase-like protein [Trichoderma sp. SZMC 28015]
MAPIVVGSLCYQYQASDVIAPFDMIAGGSKQLLEAIRTYSPDVTDSGIKNAPEFVFHHIGLSRDLVDLTAGTIIKPTCTVDDCPELDILLLGGPNPVTFDLDPRYAEFIRRHVASGKILFTNCTGAFVAAITGVLDGKNATVNHIEYEWVRQKYPKVNWSKDKKWVIDGNIWTGSGPVAGMDMMIQWLRENYGEESFKWAALNLDFEPRDIDGVNVVPFRYGADGKQLFTYVHNYYDSY